MRITLWSRRPFRMTSPKCYGIIDSQKTVKENMFNFVVSTVSVDGLAPHGAIASAIDLTIKFGHVKTKATGNRWNNAQGTFLYNKLHFWHFFYREIKVPNVHLAIFIQSNYVNDSG